MKKVVVVTKMKNSALTSIIFLFGLSISGCLLLPHNPYDNSTPTQQATFKQVILPLEVGTHFKISAGAFSCCTHNLSGYQYAWDFDVPYGTPVIAVESGKVIQVWEPPGRGGCEKKFTEQAHNIKILAADGTVAQYVHTDAFVHIGDNVERGDVIGVTADNGYHCTPQLHLNIFKDQAHIPEKHNPLTIPVRFNGLPDNGIAHRGFEGVVPPAMTVSLVKDTARSEKVRDEIFSLLTKYDLSPYIFTRHLQIEPMAIPHSDPILTLNTRHIGNADMNLTTLLHEEIHWFLDEHQKSTDQAVKQLKKLFPNAPVGAPTGAESLESTYEHLIVCWLELQADKHFLGEHRAYSTIKSQDHYTWIYKQVIDHENEIGSIAKQYHLIIFTDPAIRLIHVRGPIYVAEDNFYYEENTTLYVGKKGVTVLGATWTTETARLLVDKIRQVTDKPITAVVDTHFHLDRSGGNAYFKKIGASIISSELTLQIMKRTNWAERIKKEQKDFANYPDFPLVLPNITFKDRYSLEGGDIRILYFGPSHTDDDVVVYFPKEKVLDGDCIIKERLGYLGDANVKEYPNTLRRIQKLPAEIIIAGHLSPIHGPEIINQDLQLLKKR